VNRPAAATGLVGIDEIRAAARRIRAAARRTPLLDCAVPDESPAGPRVWLKCESLQHAGAFKLRGAYNFVARLDASERATGLVTYSSGNHAQGVAWAARAFGVPAVVVMPVDAPEVKRAAVLRLGAEVIEEGTTTTERKARAEAVLADRGGTMVPPFDDPRIIEGQGTVGLEITEQIEQERERREGSAGAVKPLGLVLVPVGGGGLVSGVAAAARSLVPGARVVGVEPTGAAKMSRSLAEGHPVTLERVDTVADGLRPVRPGDLTFRHVRELADGVVTVEDEAIRSAVLWCHRRRLVVEPSGAAALAALLSGVVAPPADAEVVAVLSGGNLDPSLFRRWLAEDGGRGA
jgi:threonine dehydratase